MIECLPTCTAPTIRRAWEPITYAAWQEYWYDANYNAAKQNEPAASTS